MQVLLPTGVFSAAGLARMRESIVLRGSGHGTVLLSEAEVRLISVGCTDEH